MMVDVKKEIENQREQAADRLMEVFETAGTDKLMLRYKVELAINHIITAAMLEIGQAQKEAIAKAFDK